jgi:hypothetical protein
MPKHGISEAASKIRSTRKRGGPRLMERESIFRKLWPDVQVKRGLQNKVYQLDAYNLLREDPRFHWLCPSSNEIRKRTGRLQMSILAELGKFDDHDLMRAVAARVCKEKPNTKAAISMIRAVRLGQEMSGDAKELARVLSSCIDRYREAHPQVASKTILAALHRTVDAVKDLPEENSDAQRDADG